MKSYIERGVQAGSSLLQSCTSSGHAELRASSPEDSSFVAGDSQLFSPLAPPLQDSPAYIHSQVYGSPFTKAEVSHAAKPRMLPQLRPPTNRHSTIRVFSLPEDSLSAAAKAEPNLVQRVVSMPEPRLASGQLTESSLSTEGYDGSMLSGGSFLSGTDTTSDSVLIIENSCGLSEAFLSDQTATKSTSPVSEKKMGPGDDGWITWARSPPRPIPALHGPLSLPYARCPSGAEGTIIEEPDNLPRVIWGLDSEEHHLGDFTSDSHMKKQDVTVQPSHYSHYSPRHYKHSNDTSSASTRTQTSAITMPSPRGVGSHDTSYGTLKPIASGGRTNVVFSRSPYNETIVLENLLERGTTAAGHQDHDYDSIGDLTRTLGHNLRLRESDIELHSSSNLDRNILPRPYGSRNSLPSSRSNLPAMRVLSRPAVGSALPQILIEPRSPEVHQGPSRRMTAMELAHQYQQHQLLKMQQQNLLPTPPNSSSPLWSSEFSPYDHHSVSPVSLRHQVVQEQLRDSEVPDQLRQLVRERLARNIAHDANASPLAPAAQINSASRLDYPGYDLDPVTSEALTNLLATQDLQHLPSLSSEALLPVTRAPQTLPGYLGHDARRYSTSHHDTVLSPTSPEEFRYTRGHPQPQIRSIPLARLMQRRLSSVPEEDSSPTIHGRSPSPPQVTRHGPDRHYLCPPAQHGYQYTEMFGSSTNYSGTYLGSASRGSQGKLRGPVFGSRSSTGGVDALDAQGRCRTRHEGGTSDKECAILPRRVNGLRKTRGRPPKV